MMESLKMLGYGWAARKMLLETAEPGRMAQACNSWIWNQKQDCRFRTSPGYTLRLCLKKKNRKTSKQTNISCFFLKMIVVNYNPSKTKVHEFILTINPLMNISKGKSPFLHTKEW